MYTQTGKGKIDDAFKVAKRNISDCLDDKNKAINDNDPDNAQSSTIIMFLTNVVNTAMTAINGIREK